MFHAIGSGVIEEALQAAPDRRQRPAAKAGRVFPAGGDAPLEWDVYGGYKGQFGASGLGYDVGLLQYYYPGSYPKPYNSPNTLEGYLGLSWEFLSFKYSYAFTDLFGYDKSDGSQYYDLGAAVDVGYGVTLAAHVGYNDIKGQDDYTDWKLGVTKDVKGYVFGLAYLGTNARDKAGDWYSFTNASTGKVVAAGADTLLVSVSKTF